MRLHKHITAIKLTLK